MASLRDGVGHLSSSNLVLREGTSIASGDGRDRRGPQTLQAINEKIIGNSTILTEPGWESIPSPYWVCNVAKRYVKMHHIDKLFLQAMWNYNHKASGVKPLYIQINPLVPRIRILFLILWRRCCTLNWC
jgi:hypothetical protein